MSTLTFPSAMNQFVATLTGCSVAKLDATHYVIVYNAAGAGNGIAVVCSISGTTITLGTPNTFLSTTSLNFAVCGLDSTHFAVYYKNSSTGGEDIVIGVVSGTTISSYGTPVNVVTSSSSENGGPQSIAMLDSTHFVCSYYNNNDANSYCVVGSVSGTTITLGTPNSHSANPLRGNYMPVSAIDSTHFFVSFDNGSPNVASRIGSVSGTTITYGTASNFITNTHRSLNMASFPIDSTHIGVSWISGGGGDGGALYTIIGVISGTTISSWGTPTSVGVTATGSAISAAQIDASNYILSYTLASTGFATSSLGTISGTTPTLSAGIAFDSQSIDTTSVNTSSTAVLDSTHFVTIWRRGTATTGQSIIGLLSSSSNGNFLTFM